MANCSVKGRKIKVNAVHVQDCDPHQDVYCSYLDLLHDNVLTKFYGQLNISFARCNEVGIFDRFEDG